MERLSIQRVNSLLDAHEDRSHIFSVKRRPATEQDVKNDSASPIIHLFAVLSIDHLRREIHGRSLWLVFELLLLEDLSNAEVDQFYALYVILFLEKDVLRFQIAMTNVMVMQIGNG